ncbi:energy transducer TonB [Spirochaeta dissipatitropha]
MIFSVLDVDDVPAIIYAPTLVYPRDARRRNLEGAVVLEVDIGADGRLINIRVVTASASIFEDSALEHIRNARFSPGRVAGRAIPVRMLMQNVILQKAQ